MSLWDQLRSVSPPSAGRGRKESQVSERTFLQVHLHQCLQQPPKAWRQKLRSWLMTEAPPSDKRQCLNGRRCGCGLLPELWCLGCRRDAWRAWLLATLFPSEKFKMRLKHQLPHRSTVLNTHTHTQKEDSHHSLIKPKKKWWVCYSQQQRLTYYQEKQGSVHGHTARQTCLKDLPEQFLTEQDRYTPDLNAQSTMVVISGRSESES